MYSIPIFGTVAIAILFCLLILSYARHLYRRGYILRFHRDRIVFRRSSATGQALVKVADWTATSMLFRDRASTWSNKSPYGFNALIGRRTTNSTTTSAATASSKGRARATVIAFDATLQIS